MYKLLTKLQAWLRVLAATDCPPDPLSRLSLRDFADLPVTHPRRDDTCSC